MLLGNLVAVLVSLQTPGTQIRFEPKAMATGSLLQLISGVYKTNLKATPSVAQEIVFVRAKSVPLADLKARLAEALDATWTVKEDGEYLGRTPTQEREIWNRHIAYRRKLVDKALSEVKEQVEKPFAATSLAKGLAGLKPRSEFNDNPN